MITTTEKVQVTIEPVDVNEVADSEFMSVIGHQDTANVVSAILGIPVDMNRMSVKLESGDILYVAQVTGGRLPEGATTIPEGMEIKFLKVTI